jgi:adenosine deaminase
MLRSLAFTLALALSRLLYGQAPPHPAKVSPSETQAAAAFEKARAAGPLALHAFLERMPKGADLHMHLSGAVYAETFLKDAAEDQLCIDPVKHGFVRNVGTSQDKVVCPDGTLPAATAFKDQKLYDAMVDSFSMRSFVPSSGISGHDQFFATFDRFGGPDKRHTGEWLDEVATRAARQNEQYLEVMMTPSFSKAISLATQFGWPTSAAPVSLGDTSPPSPPDGASRAELSALRDKLLAGGLREDVAADREQFSEALADRKKLEHCGEPNAAPACSVKIRILYQVLRAFPPRQVFAQTLLAFEVASVDPDCVGLNFVQPEDNYMAMSEYHRQMLMLDYLHSVYPAVHISLHAGELAPGLVPPASLRFHIREAVELGHAERIGHGVDIMNETDPAALLKELADRHVMVEINLTSNDVILGVKAPHHPLPDYRAAHVPIALSTDDEGVSRIELTDEYTRAAIEFHLSYADLKQMARTSIEHSFLNANDKAQQEHELESRFAAFELSLH